MRHPLFSDPHAPSGLPRSPVGTPGRLIDELSGTRGREPRRSVAEPVHQATYAIASREVAAVRIGAGRGARHEIILRSGVRLAVTYAQATHLADKIWDGIWPGERSRAGTNTAASKSKRKVTCKSKSKGKRRKGTHA